MRPLGLRAVGGVERDQRVGGDVAQQVVAGDQVAVGRVEEHGVRRRVARAMVDGERPARERQLPAVAQDLADGCAGAPAAVPARDRAERGDHLVGHAVAAQQRLREQVVALRVALEVLHDRHEDVQRADRGARAVGEHVHQPEVVGVLVGDHDPLELLDPAAERRQPGLQRDVRARRVRADVEQRERVVLDQVGVDVSDPERRGDGDAADHARISASISSRLASMSCLGDEALEVQAQQRLGVGRAHVEVPVVVVDADAVELGDRGVGVQCLDLVHLGLLVGDGGVDLAADEVRGAVLAQQRGERRLALGQQLEDQQRGDRARVRVVERLEVVVAGDLAAELAALVAHAGLEERVADAVDQRAAAELFAPCPGPPAKRGRRRGCRRRAPSRARTRPAGRSGSRRGRTRLRRR